MLFLPVELLPFIIEFQPLFSKLVFQHAKLLLVSAILAIVNPGVALEHFVVSL